MKLERYLAPRTLAGLSLFGAGMLYIATLLLGALNYFGHLVRSSWPLHLLLWVSPCLLGIVLMQAGKSALERGMIADRWSAQELDGVRRQLGYALIGPAFLCSAGVGGLCILADLVQRFSHHVHGVSLGAFSILLLAPLTTLQTLRRITAPPRPPVSPWWNRTWKPIASEHWGERGAT